MTSEQTAGWFFPTGSRKAHYDPGDSSSRALCGKWARTNPFTGLSASFCASQGEGGGPDDCKACSVKLAKLREKAAR